MFSYIIEQRDHGRVIAIYCGDTWIADTGGERYAQQIVQALNAWEEIKQVITETPRMDLIAHAVVDMVRNGVIPKNVHPAGERFKESGEEGEDLPDNCTICGGSAYTCQCEW